MNFRRLYTIGALLLAVMSCAKNESTSSNEASRQYIEAWVKKYYPEAQKTKFGVYILSETPSEGNVYNGETYAFVSYTSYDMNGIVQQTTEKKVAQQIGSYKENAYYGPKVWYTADDNLSIGLEEAMNGLRIGQTRKVLIPSWLMTQERMDTAEDYFNAKPGNATTTVYDFTLDAVTKDITKKQIEDIEAFNLKNLGKLDSLSYGFYYKQLKAPSSDKAMKKDTTVYINYTGRTLDGKVFDTTIKDTAKKYSIYSASKTYEPVKIIWAEKTEDIKMYLSGSTDGSAPIGGFQKLLWQMKADERGVGIFISDLGYGAQGSGEAITNYAPLLFDVELVKKPE